MTSNESAGAREQPTDDGLRQLLSEPRVVAVVGMSDDLDKPAGEVPAFLREQGHRVVPVNPMHDRVQGDPSYEDVAAVPDDIDVVEVFRPAGEAADVARQAARAGAATLWLQLGIRSEDARQIAEEAGMGYIEDRCMAVETRRLGLG
jgi:predicted CoA-binding protein